MSVPVPVAQLGPTDVGIPLSFMRRQAYELAKDLAMQLDREDKLAEAYNLTPFQWQILKIWPSFVQMRKDASEELCGPAGTMERARRKAALAVDAMIIHDMAVISGDAKATNRDRIAAAQVLVDVGAVSSKAQLASAGAQTPIFGGALVQIFLPNGQQMHVGAAPAGDPTLPAINGDFAVVPNE